ncbi:MAG: B12-binding domain-containing radical SAM protein, partial [bacterium]
KVIDELIDFGPDLVGFPCTTGIHAQSLQFAGQMKERLTVKTIFGGPHPTFFPEIINDRAVDIVCRGEGEYALLEIADKIDANANYTGTLSCWFKVEGKIIENEQRDLIENLDELPFPDRELYISKYPYLKKSQKAFIGGRGCPFDCTFCFNHVLMKLYKGKGKLVRYRSVDNLLQEIEEVRSNHRLKTVYMQDDTLILKKKWVSEFTEKYKRRIDLPFLCLIRADLAEEEIIRNLSEAGCHSAYFGVECGSEKLRRKLLKKSVSDSQIIETARILHKYKIKFRTYNMMGLPGETLDEALRTVSLNSEIRTDYPWCSLFFPYPGTELAGYAEKNRLLERPDDKGAPASFFKGSMVKSEDKDRFVNLQKLFFFGVKFPALLPLIKRLIRFKPNKLFELAFLAGYAWCFMKSENLPFGEMISVGSRNIKKFFFS